MRKTREDAHELATLCSLRTASSDTLRLDAPPKDAPAKDSTFPRSRNECKRLASRERARLAASKLAGWEPEQHAAFEVLLELTREDEYGPEIRKAAMDLLLCEKESGRINHALARSLVALPLEETRAFFTNWSHQERIRWEQSSKITLRTSPHAPPEFWSSLITSVAQAHPSLDRPRALALLEPFGLTPLMLLFPATSTPAPATLTHAYAIATYDDRLPHARASDWLPAESDIALEAFAAYFSALRDPAPLNTLLDTLAAAIDPRATPASACDRTALLAAAPGIRLGRAPAPHAGAEALLLDAHPASAPLLFAARLAVWSPAARRGLVARGVVRAIERLYDADEGEVDTACGPRAVSAISHHIMLALCHALLGALGECYDAARSTLMEELREEIVSYSRSMSGRLFVPDSSGSFGY